MRDALIKSWHHGKIVKIVCLPLLWQFSLNKCNLTFSLPNNNIYSYQLVKTMQFTDFYIEIKLILCIIKFSFFGLNTYPPKYFLLLIRPLGENNCPPVTDKTAFHTEQLCAQLNKLPSSFDCRCVREHEACVNFCFFIKPFL